MTVLAAAVAVAAVAGIPASAVMQDAFEAEFEALLADPGTLCGAGRSKERGLCVHVHLTALMTLDAAR